MISGIGYNAKYLSNIRGYVDYATMLLLLHFVEYEFIFKNVIFA